MFLLLLIYIVIIVIDADPVSKQFAETLNVIGSELDGAFAEYCLVPEQLVYTLPDNVSFDAAAFIEPMACAYSVN